ncbi:MAG: hypothetical protein ACTSPV_15700 [Candidatus Hodarchaeales archaeon]
MVYQIIAVDFGIMGFIVVESNFGSKGWLVLAVILIICGIIAFYGYQQLTKKKKSELLTWGIIYLVLGIVGGTLGGLLTLIGNIVLLLDYFHESPNLLFIFLIIDSSS